MQRIRTIDVAQLLFAALDSHLCDEQDAGELDGWTAIMDGENEERSMLSVTIGTVQAFRITVEEVTRKRA